MFSIYHFFAHLLATKDKFHDVSKLEDFPFDETMLSCQNKSEFPDMAIRISPPNPYFTGGEFIELKDSKTYGMPSFNSTIPTGKKSIEKVVPQPYGVIHNQMVSVGDNIYSLSNREVFYLVRGRQTKKRANTRTLKVCLVHGSFFETVKIEHLIKRAFSQVIDERIDALSADIPENMQLAFKELFTEQEAFSKVRDVEEASVTLRFRIMTEAKAEGNVFSSKYPEIGDNTLNFLIPIQSPEDIERERYKMELAIGTSLSSLTIFPLKHSLNDHFLVFQVPL